MINLLCAINPFIIEFETKKDLDFNDSLEVQNLLRNVQVEEVIDSFYREIENPWISWEQFYFRCSRGIKQTLVKEDPKTDLQKIGQGGDRCICCFVSQDKEYPELLASLAPQLEKIGFNGYFYTRVGGFPNPTGKEIQYAGVPYCFKIFTMMEAANLGFSSLLWIDSATLPLADLSPLFEIVESSGALFFEEAQDRHLDYIFPSTRELLKDLTSIDVFEVPSVRACAIGLKMNDPLTKEFLEQYMHMVELGLPFCSGYPEEFVFTAILNQDCFKSWQANVIGGSIDWESLKRRYSRNFSWGPSWLIAHYDPKPGDIPAFFYIRPHK